jgi:hypothetical protein
MKRALLAALAVSDISTLARMIAVDMLSRVEPGVPLRISPRAVAERYGCGLISARRAIHELLSWNMLERPSAGRYAINPEPMTWGDGIGRHAIPPGARRILRRINAIHSSECDCDTCLNGGKGVYCRAGAPPGAPAPRGTRTSAPGRELNSILEFSEVCRVSSRLSNSIPKASAASGRELNSGLSYLSSLISFRVASIKFNSIRLSNAKAYNAHDAQLNSDFLIDSTNSDDETRREENCSGNPEAENSTDETRREEITSENPDEIFRSQGAFSAPEKIRARGRRDCNHPRQGPESGSEESRPARPGARSTRMPHKGLAEMPSIDCPSPAGGPSEGILGPLELDTTLPGPIEADVDSLGHALRLVARFYRDEELAAVILDHRHVFPSEWFGTALRRIKAKGIIPRSGNYWTYLRAMLMEWQRNGGPDVGAENDYDEDMNLKPAADRPASPDVRAPRARGSFGARERGPKPPPIARASQEERESIRQKYTHEANPTVPAPLPASVMARFERLKAEAYSKKED